MCKSKLFAQAAASSRGGGVTVLPADGGAFGGKSFGGGGGGGGDEPPEAELIKKIVAQMSSRGKATVVATKKFLADALRPGDKQDEVKVLVEEAHEMAEEARRGAPFPPMPPAHAPPADFNPENDDTYTGRSAFS